MCRHTAMMAARALAGILRSSSLKVDPLVIYGKTSTLRTLGVISSSRQYATDKVYEIRTYSLYPKDVKEFMAISEEKLHLRLRASKIIGYWTSEIGGMNQVFHIWEYDSLKHRAQVRAALASDPDWLSQYISRVISMWCKQDNLLTKAIAGPDGDLDQDKGNLYFLQRYNSNSSSMSNLTSELQSLQSGTNIKLAGGWSSILGPKDTAYLLWQCKDPDDFLVWQENSSEKVKVVPEHSQLLIPCPWSPLK
ncbi:protein NipSnap homolog 3A isoform X2 [Lingula anatina]|uniref:Protein NipSnap homolog 3A isoform X2 n=1 Tax=Lingula anatina TaxID=7574 RepID=A0A1S3JT78_LINAN|nr:protein NipSnap homolog 3A isoform X2 [Lingula anatina]|eukprot:XP_013413542.1 protein NipSnap homolog 3A isoform X2 [Lingula anatina]